MLKFLVALLLTALLGFAGSLFFPWLVIAIAAFVVAVAVNQPPFRSFLAGFLALFLLWGTQAYIIDQQNNHLLATKIALLFQLGSSANMFLLTAFIGGIVGGMSALTGGLLRRVGKGDKKDNIPVPAYTDTAENIQNG